MKKLLHFALLATITFVISCEGPEGPEGPAGPAGGQGPPGPAGPAGQPGTAPNGTVLDLSGWNFEEDEDGNYALGLLFEDYDLSLSETDALMVYRLVSIVPIDEDTEVPLWAPLPQTINGEEGSVQYSFVFSPLYVFIIIISDFNLDEYPGVTDDQVFRIVKVPGEALEGAKISASRDLSSYSYEELIETFNISDENVLQISQ